MKTFNIVGKNNDMVITISGKTPTEVIREVEETMRFGAYRIEEVEDE